MFAVLAAVIAAVLSVVAPTPSADNNVCAAISAVTPTNTEPTVVTFPCDADGLPVIPPTR